MQEKRKVMKSLNNKGSILQIVLVIFMIALSVISVSCYSILSKSRSYKDIDILIKQKNLEIMLVRYYITTIENDILLGDSIDEEEYSVSYTVDNMGSYSLITTSVNINEYQYQFIVQIENESIEVKKIEYLEG